MSNGLLRDEKSALACEPTVFVIGDEYEIFVLCKSESLVRVRVGEIDHYERNSGVLHTQKRFARVRVPQSALDTEKKYTVITEKTLKRSAYDSALDSPVCETFEFSPLPADGIKIYHLADIHGRFELALRCGEYFDGGADLYILNGDMHEIERESDMLETLEFSGTLARGRKPVIFARGNHDTRGAAAEKLADYFPSANGDFFYTFSMGNISGAVFDCGEDKLDSDVEYGGNGTDRGVNDFAAYRRRETEYFASLTPLKNKFVIAVGHINPSQAAYQAGSIFDIEREVYSKWSEIFDRLGVQFMLSGHMHDAYVLMPNDARSLLRHSYPVIVGSKCEFAPEYPDENLWGTAIVLNGDKAKIRFTDKTRRSTSEIEILLSNK